MKPFDLAEVLQVKSKNSTPFPRSEWLKTYNERWLIERHGYRSPAQVRRDFVALQEAA
ncbi:MAG TPA: hypothetical protein VNP04_22395 [Alphaproteobacteria bacterium]|nr:hypothetical protein [Alphaproteobacteria bacterium]